MKIVAIADCHRFLPTDLPEANVLVIAGDASWTKLSQMANWFNGKFKRWLKNQPFQDIIFVPGNHDLIFELMPKLVKLDCHVLIDQEVVIDSIKFYGSPWTIKFRHWAFMKEDRDLEKIWNNIPKDTDVLIAHGPPYGIGDLVTLEDAGSQNNMGSKTLLKRIFEIHLKYCFFGHNHGEYGEFFAEPKIDTRFFNVSYVDEDYHPKKKPYIIIEI